MEISALIIVIALVLVAIGAYVIFGAKSGKSKKLDYAFKERDGALTVQGTSRTPTVLCDRSKGVIEIRGRSMPENSHEFYRPIEKWIDAYVKEPHPVTQLFIELQYFNTSSSQCLVAIFKKMEHLHESSEGVTINWVYEDDDMLMAGQDYESIISVPFKFIEVVETGG